MKSEVSLHVIKVGRKWRIKEEGEGWIYKRAFNRKWKVEAAISVFQSGGGLKDYFNRIRYEPSHLREPTHALAIVEERFHEILQLSPTCEEIKAFADYMYSRKLDHGVVTVTNGSDYFLNMHDTYGIKLGGRVHIDAGCNGIHLMLDKNVSGEFLEFIKHARSKDK